MSASTPQPGQRYWQALAPVWRSVSIYEGVAAFREQYSRLRPELRTLFAAHWLHSEVCNGGFHQFFSNPTGILAPEAYAAFGTLKLEDAAALIQQAMSFFGAPYPREQEHRRAMLSAIPGKKREEFDPFFKLDPQYYRLLPSSTHSFKLAADAYAELNDA